MKSKLSRIVVLTAITLIMLALPVLAAVTYSANIQVEEDGTSTYSMLQCQTSLNVLNLVDAGYITATGLDTRVQSGTTELPHMLGDDRVLFATPVPSGTSSAYSFTTNNAALSAYPVITGDNGRVTIADVAVFEPGGNFDLDERAYVDVTAPLGYLVNDDNRQGVFGVNWVAQTFTTTTAFSVNSVWVKMERPLGNPGNITAAIRVAAGGVPTGANLTTGTFNGNTVSAAAGGSWYPISLSSYPLEASKEYALVLSAPAGDGANWIGWRDDITAPTYADGNMATSVDSGVNWTAVAGTDCMFEINPRILLWKQEAIWVKVSAAGEIAATIQGGATVAATTITTGVRRVLTTGDGVNLTIYVYDESGGLIDSTSAAIGAAVPNTAYDWLLIQANIPYMSYYKHSVPSAALIGHYEPANIVHGVEYTTGTAAFTNGSALVTGTATVWTDAMIGSAIKHNANNVWHIVQSVEDTTHLTLTSNYSAAGGAAAAYTIAPRIPDLVGAAPSQEAAITWGSNPTGVTVTLGALLPTGEITIQPLYGGAPDAVGVITQSSSMYTDATTPPTTEITPILDDVSSLTGTPVWFLWWFLYVFCTFVAMGLVARYARNLFMTGLAAFVVAGLFVTMGVVPFWFLIIMALIVAGLAAMERSPNL